MLKFNPLLLVGGVIGIFSLVFIIAYLSIKDKKASIGFDRNMKDSEIAKRLLVYAKPHVASFIFVLFLMLFSIAYDIASPLLIGKIEAIIAEDFTMKTLLGYVAVYGAILAVSLISSYIQAIVLQKVGQRIISAIRMDLFKHIESLSHSSARLAATFSGLSPQ